MPTWRTLDDAAKQSGVSRRTLQRWVQQGRLTPYTIAGDPKQYLDLDAIRKLREPTPSRPLIRLGPERLSRSARALDRGGFRGDLALAGRRERVDIEVRRVPADPDVAGRLQVEGGTRVLARIRTMYADEQPVQLAQSYLPLDLVEGTRLTETDTGPGGTYARLEEILANQRPSGRLDHFEEEITARAATAAERKALQLAPGVPVIRIVRTAYADDGRVVEVCDTQAAGDRYQLVYRVPAE